MKTILFTGARSGIVACVIEKLKRKNYEIYVTVHTETQLEIVKEKYRKDKNIHCMKLDVTDKQDREKLTNLDIDILFCNAAVGYGGSIAEMDMGLVRYNFDVNVFSNFEVVQIVLVGMIARNKGKILLMSSLAALYPPSFLGSYAATKASISSLALTLRRELKLISSMIEVAVIEPGFYHTGFNQVMFQNKYEWMDTSTYFATCLSQIRKKEGLLERYIEKKNLCSIERKIIEAIKDKHTTSIYRAPFLQTVFAKTYQILFR